MRNKLFNLLNDNTMCHSSECEEIADLLIESGVIKHQGKWINTSMNCVILCSACGERLELCYPDGTEVRALPYCPHCGAKMQEDDEQ